MRHPSCAVLSASYRLPCGKANPCTDSQSTTCVLRGGVVEPGGGRGVDEHPVGPGGARDRAEPVVAQGEGRVARAYEVGQLCRGVEAQHDVADVVGRRGRQVLVGDRRVVRCEAVHRDRRVGPSGRVGLSLPGQLDHHVPELVSGVGGHRRGRRTPDRVGRAVVRVGRAGRSHAQAGDADWPNMWSNERFSSMSTKTLLMGE